MGAQPSILVTKMDNGFIVETRPGNQMVYLAAEEVLQAIANELGKDAVLTVKITPVEATPEPLP